MGAFEGFGNIWKLPELRARVLFTLGLLAVYRVGIYITVPGVDRTALAQTMASSSSGLVSFFNMFSGGAMQNASIFYLGIMPYISASIVFQLLTMVMKPLEELRKEGEAGQRKLNQYMRYATVGIATAQGMFWALKLQGHKASEAAGISADVVANPGFSFVVTSVLTWVTGTMFLMWLGERITERGVGNGTSLLIFAGIVDGIPTALFGYFQANAGNIQPLNVTLVGFMILACVAIVVFFERGQRRIPIYYARRIVGKRVYGGQNSHLPLKVNTAGTIGPIFASALLTAPGYLANIKWLPGMAGLASLAQRGDWMFNIAYATLIIFFCFFYTSVQLPAIEVADNLKKQQAFIPGIRQGKATAEYIDYVLTRVTLGGALYIAAVCILPGVISNALRVPFQWGGTSIMIVVGVALETASQVEAHLISRHYDGLAEGGGRAGVLRGRREA